MKFKKRLLIIIIILLIILGIIFIPKIINNYKVKHAKIVVTLKDDLTAEFNTKVKVSDYIESINGKVVDDYDIDTTKIGEKEINFEYINEDNIKINYNYKINILDKTEPLIWLGSTYSVAVGAKDTIVEDVLCGDNYDNNPKCYIEGDYDLNTIGKYNVIFKAEDSSGNIASKNFTINVYKPSDEISSNKTPTYTYFSDVVKNYKNENNKIGLDISEWQDTVDFEKLKNAGVEFIILRIGGTKGREGAYFLDSTFKENIEKANKANMPVGLYFYSYATSIKKARENAEWILKQIEGYKVDLEIAFDWENWNNFNKYHISFYELTNMANTFIKTIEDAGYKGMNYSSKTYLENMWMNIDYPVWLAHYTSKTTYEGSYKYWQLCNNGIVDGINGTVDIDIMYE